MELYKPLQGLKIRYTSIDGKIYIKSTVNVLLHEGEYLDNPNTLSNGASHTIDYDIKGKIGDPDSFYVASPPSEEIKVIENGTGNDDIGVRAEVTSDLQNYPPDTYIVTARINKNNQLEGEVINTIDHSGELEMD